jgi:hypothetical protein
MESWLARENRRCTRKASLSAAPYTPNPTRPNVRLDPGLGGEKRLIHGVALKINCSFFVVFVYKITVLLCAACSRTQVWLKERKKEKKLVYKSRGWSWVRAVKICNLQNRWCGKKFQLSSQQKSKAPLSHELKKFFRVLVNTISSMCQGKIELLLCLIEHKAMNPYK